MSQPLMQRGRPCAKHRLACGLVMVGYIDARDEIRSVMASSFNSVSLTPRLVMWCISNERACRPEIGVGTHCGLSVLAADHHERWAQYANDCDMHRFEWMKGAALGVPLLMNAAACFEVEIRRRIDQKSGVLYVGEVNSFAYSETSKSLFSYLDDVGVPLVNDGARR